jgi:K+-sensing histidine kinase KdpD
MVGQADDDQGAKPGRLTIFFGYAAGVGKTYAMLADARERQAAGVDVVIGYLEPHARPATTALAEGLERLSVRSIDFQGVSLREFDVDAALERHPQLVLVDELAHSNAPGSRNRKRYQDVEELLQAGIDVSTTVNVQHLESLNNVVGQATATRVRETVPDYVFERADKVKLIDIEPEELLARLEAGEVYAPDQAATAMSNFFTPENLKVLREVAIREAANRISHELQAERLPKERSTDARWLVCVSSSPKSARCIRWTARLAASTYSPWVAAFVEDGNQDHLTVEAHEAKHSNLDLAASLGAEVVTLSGVDRPATIADYVQASAINSVVVGAGRPSTPWRPSFADRLRALLPGVELHIVPDDLAEDKLRRFSRSEDRFNFSWPDAAKSLAFLLAATGVGLVVDRIGGGLQNVMLTYILSVLATARVTRGYVWGLIGSVLSVVMFNFVFVPPTWSLASFDGSYWVTLLLMLVVAVITSAVTGRVKRQGRLAAKREQRTEAMFELGRRLLVTEGSVAIVQVINQYVVKSFHRSVVFYTDFRTPGGPIQQWNASLLRDEQSSHWQSRFWHRVGGDGEAIESGALAFQNGDKGGQANWMSAWMGADGGLGGGLCRSLVDGQAKVPDLDRRRPGGASGQGMEANGIRQADSGEPIDGPGAGQSGQLDVGLAADAANSGDRPGVAIGQTGVRTGQSGDQSQDSLGAAAEDVTSNGPGPTTAFDGCDPTLPGFVLEAIGEHAGFLRSPSERKVAEWVFTNRKMAGAGTDTLNTAGALYLPVLSRGNVLGVLGVSCETSQPSRSSRFFLQTILALSAMALERQHLTNDRHQVLLSSQRERMRGNMLHALSYDLTGPLADIVKVTDQLERLRQQDLDQMGTARPEPVSVAVSDRADHHGTKAGKVTQPGFLDEREATAGASDKPGHSDVSDREVSAPGHRAVSDMTGKVTPEETVSTISRSVDSINGALGVLASQADRTDVADAGAISRPPQSARPGSQRLRSDPAIAGQLRRIRDDAAWLQALVRNLTSVTRITDGSVELRLVPVSMDKLIERACDRLLLRYPDRQFIRPERTDWPLVPVDSLLIEQVLLTLGENAARHTAAPTSIDYDMTVDGTTMTVDVRDHGPGLPAALLNTAFTGDDVALADGRGGIGMTICQAIISAHEGRIWAANAEDGGAVFRFSLPLYQPSMSTESEGDGA